MGVNKVTKKIKKISGGMGKIKLSKKAIINKKGKAYFFLDISIIFV